MMTTAPACARSIAALTALLYGCALPLPALADITNLSLEQLMDMKVVGASKYEQKQSEVAAAVSIITRDDIRRFGWRSLDEALESLPGIHTTYDRQYSYLGTRGFGVPGDANTRLLVSINGNRVNDSLYDIGPMGGRFPLDLGLVERIEFIPGPGGAVYGQNAMFGVVNVITRDESSLKGAEGAWSGQSAQRLREGRVSFGKTFDDGTHLLVSATGMRAKGSDPVMAFGSTGITGSATGLDGERDRKLFIRAGKGPLTFDLAIGDRRKDDPTGAFLSDPLVPGQFQGDRFTVAQLKVDGTWLNGKLQSQARVFGGKMFYSSTLHYGNPVHFPASGDWRGAELRLLYSGVQDHRLMLGVELQDNPHVVQNVIDTANAANNLTISSPIWRAGLFVQDEWSLSPDWRATLGLRVDRESEAGTKTSPRAALIWQLRPTTTLKALLGRAHRSPNAFEREYQDGVALVANPALKGERIDTFEWVMDHRVGSDLALRASVYRWSIKGLVTLGLDPVSGLAQYQTGDPVKAQGLELSADKTWTGGMRLGGSLSLQYARYDGGVPLVNAPRTLAKLHFSTPLPVKGVTLGYQGLYSSARLTLDGSQTPAYAVSNLHLNAQNWLAGLDLGLGVRNVFDKRYRHPAADSNWQNSFEQDGRSVHLQAQVRY